MDGVDIVGVEHDRLVAEARDQPRIPVADTVDRADAVIERENFNKALDHMVQPGAEASCRDDGDPAPRGVVEDLAVRAGAFERGRDAQALGRELEVLDVFRDEDALVVVDEIAVANR